MAGPAAGKDWVRNLYEIHKRAQQVYAGTDLGLPILAVRQDSATDLAGTGGSFAPLQLDTSGRLRVITESGDISYAEDTPHTSGDAGVMLLGVRQNSATSMVSTGGDYSPLIVDGSGRLYVADEMGDVSYAEDTAHTSGDAGIMLLGVRQDTLATLASTTGDYTPLSVDANGRLYVVTELGDISFAEDSPHTSGDAGLEMLAVRQDTLSSLASTTGDYVPLVVNADGRLYVADEMGDVSYPEDTHHTSGDAGIMLLAVRQDTASSLVSATGDYSPLSVEGLMGALLVKAAGAEDAITGRIESTDGAVQVYAAPGTGFRREVSLWSAQHSTTGVPVACAMTLLSATQALWAIELSADTAFGGAVNFDPTLKLGENKALNLQLSVANAGVRYCVQSDVYPVG